MKSPISYALVTLVLTSLTWAGQVYGTIFHNGQPLPNVAVTLRCSGEESTGNTDGAGVYRVYVKASASVYSYDRPTSYDFDLVDQGGHSTLVPHRR